MRAEVARGDILAELFGARSVAIVGDSGSGRGQGAVLRRRLADGGYDGAIYPINPKYREIGGLPAYGRLADVPGGVELVACALPAELVPGVLEDAAEAGARGVIVLAAGFAEAGASGASRQEELARRAEELGISVVGPNSLGIGDLWSNGQFYFGELAGGLQRGGVGIVFQSGALVETITEAFVHAGIGVSQIATTGNELNLDTAACIEALAANTHTKIIACVLESVRDGARLRRVALRARAMGKVVVALCNGLTEAGRRVAISHTGALVGDRRSYAAIMSSAGIVRVDDIEQLVEAVVLLTTPTGRSLLGRGAGPVAVVSHSGGVCALMCDLAADVGLPLAALSEATIARLRKLLPPYCSVGNPLDMTAVGGLNAAVRDEVLAVLAEETSLAAVVYGVPSTDVFGASNPAVYPQPILLSAVQSAASGYPVVFTALTARQVPGEVASDLIAQDSPLLCGARAGLTALRAVLAARVPVEKVDIGRPDQEFGAVLDGIRELTDVAGERQSKALLGRAGVPVIAEHLAHSEEEAVSYAERADGPVAIKAEMTGLVHKSDIGAVCLDVAGEQAVRAAFRHVTNAAAARGGSGEVLGALVQRMAGDGVDMIVGVSWDDHLGALVACGIGGVLAEAIDDVSVRCAPVTHDEALAMIAELRLARILTHGFRHLLAADVEELARVVRIVSELAAELGRDLDSIDLNPVRVLPRGHGVIVLDATIVPSTGRRP